MTSRQAALLAITALLVPAAWAQPTGPDVNYDESRVGELPLPDPLVFRGQDVEDAATWTGGRRGEILELFRSEVYGRNPAAPEPPLVIRFEVDPPEPALDGRATRREVRVLFGEKPGAPAMDLLVFVPKETEGPVPAFLALNFRGNHSIHPDAGIRLPESWLRAGPGVAENRATDVLPVAVVSNDAVLKDEARDFRSGAVAIVPRGAGADSIARRLVELSEEIPRRPGVVAGALSESNLPELLALVSDETKTGILSIRSPKGVVEGMPVVVETVRPAPERKQEIIDLLTEAVADHEALEYEFHETTGGRLSLLPSASATDEVDLTHLFGARVVVLDSDQLRAEKLANLLISRGVQIAAADFSTAVLPRIREVDPQVVVLDSSAVGGEGVDFVRAMRKDPQLRWASMLVVRWEDFWPESTSESSPDLAQLAGRLLPLIDQDAEHARRAEDEVDFDTRLELIGPGRLLRALGSVPGVRRLSINGQQRSIQVDVADNSILAAYATLQEGTKQTLQGMPALLALWGLSSGRVSVREQDLPSVANIMMPVDEALGLVSHQLGFAGGGIEVDAATIPPEKSASEAFETDVPAPQLDDARTMAPARFGHLRPAVGAPAPPDFPRAEFREEEIPTN